MISHLLEPGDLLANEEIERHFWDEQARPSAISVVYRRPNVLIRQPFERVNHRQTVREDLVEDVTLQEIHKRDRDRWEKAKNHIIIQHISRGTTPGTELMYPLLIFLYKNASINYF